MRRPLTLWAIRCRFESAVRWTGSNMDRTDGFNAGLTVDHTGSYQDVRSSLRGRSALQPWTFGSVIAAAGRMARWHGDRLNVINALDQAPPFVDINFGYDVLNYRPNGSYCRLLRSEELVMTARGAQPVRAAHLLGCGLEPQAKSGIALDTERASFRLLRHIPQINQVQFFNDFFLFTKLTTGVFII